MIDLRTIDELTRKLAESMPPGVTQAKDDLEQRFRSVLTGAFERMNLVGREQYEAQCTLLEETRMKLRDLEKRLDELSSGS
jgi:hypothetical protein